MASLWRTIFGSRWHLHGSVCSFQLAAGCTTLLKFYLYCWPPPPPPENTHRSPQEALSSIYGRWLLRCCLEGNLEGGTYAHEVFFSSKVTHHPASRVTERTTTACFWGAQLVSLSMFLAFAARAALQGRTAPRTWGFVLMFKQCIRVVCVHVRSSWFFHTRRGLPPLSTGAKSPETER